MKLKYWNRFLLGIVAVVLFLTTLVLIKILFSGVEKFEWGNVSDWFSSLSSFGTFIIAFMAYKSAPDWISRKNIEDGSTHAEHFVNITIETALFDIDKSKFILDKLINQVNSDHIPSTRKRCFDNLEPFNSVMLSIASNCTLINSQLLKLHRFGWNLKDDFNEGLLDYICADDIIKSYKADIAGFYELLAALKFKLIEDSIDVNFENTRVDFNETTTEFMVEILKWQKSLQKISNSSGAYNNFFNITK
ncbi:MAG: hypothetical protein ACRCT4_13490 [Silvania sp.]